MEGTLPFPNSNERGPTVRPIILRAGLLKIQYKVLQSYYRLVLDVSPVRKPVPTDLATAVLAGKHLPIDAVR